MSDYDTNAVSEIIINGFNNEADHDAIRLEMFKQGVPFNKINAVFKEVAIEGGYMADPKIVREGIADVLADVDLGQYTEWSQVEAAAEAICNSVEGSTLGQVTGAMKREAEAQELDFPVKPKAGPRSRGASKIKSMIVDLYNSNKEIGSTELLDAIIVEVTGDFRVRNCIEYVNMYLPMMIAADRGIALAEVKLAGFDKPALEAKYGGTTSYVKADEAEMEEEDDMVA